MSSTATVEADESWRTLALSTIEDLALKKTEFSADDAWLSGLPRPANPRALGPVFIQAQKAGVIEDTGRLVKSVYASGHHGPRRVWRSLVAVSQ
ncbi:hypothetical protein [Streptomyces sp. NBC_01198]|uniref:hypothetical protein n=1 Tax=Streptomyces sp. NBC_01198 TaxID=2903769 RepID=UPI002E0DD9C1|nr:hypothetical protein OG702_32225 [Streptomyces sp. NBC_01198]